MDQNAITHLIEQERNKMHALAEQYGLTDPRVVAQSQHLDQILNIPTFVAISDKN